MVLDRSDFEVNDAVRQIRSICYFHLCKVWGIKPTLEGCQRYINEPTKGVHP